MKNQETWLATKFEFRRARLRGSRSDKELGVGSRLVADLVAQRYQANLPEHARGRLLDLGCGKVPLYAAYKPYVSAVTCVDWTGGDYIDFECDLSRPLPFINEQFDTIILSDVLEHIPEPQLLWREMARILAPDGKIIMNVPFFYWIHAHPFDYYRYTNFALQRFVEGSELRLVSLNAIGGVVEVLADIVGKAVSKIPLIGYALSAAIQSTALSFQRTGVGQRLSDRTARNIPLGYFVIAQRPR